MNVSDGAVLRLGFADFWPGFDAERNFFTDLLREHFPVQIADDPDVLFYSYFGRDNEQFRKPLRFFFTGENVRPNLWACDYALSFDFLADADRHYRWPLYNLYFDPMTPANSEPRQKFCCMVVSNPANPLRGQFFAALSRYRQVDSGGKYLNNVGGPVPDKFDFIKQYRFCIAFENAAWPGYTTEKLMEAKTAGCIPIYWGNPRVSDDFNPEGFVSLHDFPTIGACVEHIARIDADPDWYERLRGQPLLSGGAYTRWSDRRLLTEWLIPRVRHGRRRRRFPRLLSRARSWGNAVRTVRENRHQLTLYEIRD